MSHDKGVYFGKEPCPICDRIGCDMCGGTGHVQVWEKILDDE